MEGVLVNWEDYLKQVASCLCIPKLDLHGPSMTGYHIDFRMYR